MRFDLEPTPMLEAASDLLDRDLDGATIDNIDVSGRVVTGLRAKGATLRITNARDARFAGCDLDACELSYSSFDATKIEQCRFERSNLEATSWHSAQATSCSFADASLVDACLDNAVLRDCDFRGADLSVIESTLPDGVVRLKFLTCDLRNTRWSGRSLEGAQMFECKLHGAHGTPITIDSIEIVRPDLSELGDRSLIGSAGDVFDLWRCAPRFRRPSIRRR
jgi:uncharacterized protein YjbI with pentapeptide repeats